jgi:hypothetical protein
MKYFDEKFTRAEYREIHQILQQNFKYIENKIIKGYNFNNYQKSIRFSNKKYIILILNAFDEYNIDNDNYFTLELQLFTINYESKRIEDFWKFIENDYYDIPLIPIRRRMKIKKLGLLKDN